MSPADPKGVVAPAAPARWWGRHPKTTLIGVVGGVLLLALLAGEIILSGTAAHPGIPRFINFREHRPLFQDALGPTAEDRRNAPDLPCQAYRLEVDAHGFIKPTAVHAHPQVTVVFLGGSTTECLYMAETERFPYQAGRRLEQALQIPVNSLNAGRAGNNSLHSLNILLNKIVPLRPEIVVMMHNINDLIILLYEETYWNQNPYKAPILTRQTTLGQSLGELLGLMRDQAVPHLARALTAAWPQWGGETPTREFTRTGDGRLEIHPARLLRAFRANLQLFVDLCHLYGLTPVLMTQASRFTAVPDDFIAGLMRRQEEAYGIAYPDWQRLFAGFNAEIRAVGQANGIVVIDLVAAIPPEPVYLYDAVHLTARGASLASEIIYRDLAALLRPQKDGGP